MDLGRRLARLQETVALINRDREQETIMDPKPKGRIVATTDYLGRPRVQTEFHDESLTVQSDAHLADINQIMRAFGAGGMDILDEAKLVYADVTSFTDFHDVMNQAREAEVEFLKLPSKVREIFEHDVSIWLDTAHDDDKREALVDAGFIKAREVVPPRGTSGEASPDPTGGPETAGDTGSQGTT